MELRNLQKWEMSEYTKRLPGFIDRSKNKMNDFMKLLSKGKIIFLPEDRNEKIAKIFLKELASEIEKKYINEKLDDNLGVFLKVKPF